MRIHHLNCGTHRPVGGAFFDGRKGRLLADLCTHCLLIEADDGLILIDTGYGLEDMPPAPRRLAHLWPLLLNTRLRTSDTALRQIEGLGFARSDVRHIVLTHLDFDHAGGVADFPQARVHVMASERAAAAARHGLVGRQRYRPLQWEHVQDWRSYAPAGERWNGFGAVRQLDGLPPEILLVPLPGHTLGHAGVAVSTETGWLLDAGDAYLHSGELESPPAMPLGLRLYERLMAADPKAARQNLARLRDVHNSADVTVFCSHDSGELAALQAASDQPCES